MKIRIKDNSIRLRLTQAEVDSIRDNGLVTSATRFPDGRAFLYALESSPACVAPDASFSDSTISIRVPEADVLAWAATSQVSISGQQVLSDGGALSILVEKDFACLAPRAGEDESDMYPHPGASGENC